MGHIDAETTNGVISFSYEAYTDAMERYTLGDMLAVVELTESGLMLDRETVDFVRDFAIVQAEVHPDTDRGIGIGSLAMRLDLATGRTSEEEFKARGVDIDGAIREFELAFGLKTALGRNLNQ